MTHKANISVDAGFNAIRDRNITKETCATFGCRSDNDKHYYAYVNGNDDVIAYKVRTCATKDFHSIGSMKGVKLFGQHLFNKGGKFLTIVEGELDALAAYQMMGSKYPVVSLINGAGSALRNIKDNFEFVDSFETVVLAFDNDAPGKEATEQVAELLGGKCKVLKFDAQHKDSCDYLKQGQIELFVKTWWAAEQYVPDGIVKGDTLWEEVMKPVESSLAKYPWAGLNDVTYGIREAELVMVCAGSGLGKSQFLREILHHLLMTTEGNIGCMFLEESIAKTAKSIMSINASKPLHLPDTVTDEDELKKAFDNTLGSGRIYLWDNFGSCDIDNVVSRVRFLSKACDCKYVFLDHISMVVSGGQNADERKAIDELMTKLRTLVQETKVSLIAVSHLKRPESKGGHEEGAATSLSQLRGSGAIAQLSDIVIGLVRNAQHEDPVERNTTKVSVLKNRFSGITSPHCASLLYNKDTGRMLEHFDVL